MAGIPAVAVKPDGCEKRLFLIVTIGKDDVKGSFRGRDGLNGGEMCFFFLDRLVGEKMGIPIMKKKNKIANTVKVLTKWQSMTSATANPFPATKESFFILRKAVCPRMAPGIPAKMRNPGTKDKMPRTRDATAVPLVWGA